MKRPSWLAFVAIGMMVFAAAAFAVHDTDVGIVHSTDPQPDMSFPGGDNGEPVWDEDCYEVEIKPLRGATTPGAGIKVTVYNSQPNIPPVVLELVPQDPNDPVILHCSWTSAEIEYLPGGPPDGYAGWGIKWTPAAVSTG